MMRTLSVTERADGDRGAMQAELAVLAASGATTIVQLMAQDAWATTKDRVLALFGGRGANGVESVETELDETHVAAAAGSDDMRLAQFVSQWQARLLVLLQEDPATAEQVRALVADSADQTGSVHNVISGGEVRGAVVQSRTINGDLNFG
ncbi:hypothetical protein ACFY5C_23845 [Streptomyces sp. NPDC012935]|uniref:hypothetical protein n=1 Tax=Streptomyces sp. NPDC012935 TaxID=3364857 RepID=UPI0036C776F4